MVFGLCKTVPREFDVFFVDSESKTRPKVRVSVRTKRNSKQVQEEKGQIGTGQVVGRGEIQMPG